MQTKKMLLIYNPFAGQRLLAAQLHPVLDYFVKHHFSVTVHPTQQDNDAYHLVRQTACEYDYVVCSGGDGTLNEVIRGLMEQPGKLPLLGYLPSGSTNDFAVSMGLPTDPLKAAEVVVTGSAAEIDIGQIGERYFAYIAAFGLFTDVSYDTSQSMKNILGHTAYILEGVKRLTKIEPVTCTVECDGEEFTGNFILGMLTNSASVGGFRLPREYEHTRKFSLILLREITNLTEFSEVASTLLGVTEPGPQFIIRQPKQVKVLSHNPLPWSLDGEYGGQFTQSNLQICRKALQIIIPCFSLEKEK